MYGGVRRFVPMVIVVKRVDATGALGFLKILVANNQFH
jgi:hypothetical protein